MKLILFLFLSATVLVSACRKDPFISSPDANLRITADSLDFDTVFTSTGSVTKSFKIINENNRRLRLSSVRLMGGASSVFKINVDGSPTVNATDIVLEANDSVYVFVQVTVDPGSSGLPFVLRDSIGIAFNGTERFVQLEAWGQNAHFIRNGEVVADETWTNDLPYVILGYLRVNENTTLSLEKGCRLYFHANAPLVVNGTLHVNGAADSTERVYFLGDRLDEPYRDYPAGWPGIYFSASSVASRMDYAVIRNAYQAVVSLGRAGAPNLMMNACFIDNAYDVGLLAVNSSIRADNLLISNCGKDLVISQGGNYQFNHCTLAGYSTAFIGHQYPVLSISNSDVAVTAPLSASFTNCVFWGNAGVVENEVIVEKTGTDPFNVVFDHVLWRQATSPAFSILSGIIENQDPLFVNTDATLAWYNFRLGEGSPAVNAGTSTSLVTDLDGRPRAAGLPDLGAYEQ